MRGLCGEVSYIRYAVVLLDPIVSYVFGDLFYLPPSNSILDLIRILNLFIVLKLDYNTFLCGLCLHSVYSCFLMQLH